MVMQNVTCKDNGTFSYHYISISVKICPYIISSYYLCSYGIRPHSYNIYFMDLKTPIGRLRLFAILEGISFLLFAITMPLKYGLGITAPNFYVGMAHGWLFILYIILCLQNSYVYKWNLKVTALASVASLVPFGTFIADAKIFKKETSTE